MVSHIMKTTVEIADVLMTELKIKAMREKKTLRLCLEAAISEYLKDKPSRNPYKMRDLSFKGGKGLAPGLDLDNKEQIRAILDEDRRR
jgi:hypothetical protein